MLSPLPLCLAATLALAAPAAAQNLVDASNPERILTIAKAWGAAELDRDSGGDPMIRGQMDGQRYTLLFYGCEGNANCKSVQFWSYLPRNAAMTAEAVNAWNSGSRFAAAYFDKDGDLSFRYDVNLFGGVTEQNLDDSFDWWRAVLRRAGETFPAR